MSGGLVSRNAVRFGPEGPKGFHTKAHGRTSRTLSNLSTPGLLPRRADWVSSCRNHSRKSVRNDSGDRKLLGAGLEAYLTELELG
jgi:hypothetical protein